MILFTMMVFYLNIQKNTILKILVQFQSPRFQKLLDKLGMGKVEKRKFHRQKHDLLSHI